MQAARSESRDDTDVSQDDSERRFGPSAQQKAREKTARVTLRENPTRVATHHDLENAVAKLTTEIKSQVSEAVAQSMAAASSSSGSAAPKTPPWPPHWQSQGRHRSANSGWVSRKQMRAQQDHERKQRGEAKTAPSFEIPMCTTCGKNQPGSRCPNRLRRNCCPGCQQHF